MFFLLSIYLLSEIKDLLNFHNPSNEQNHFFFQMSKKLVNGQCKKIKKHLSYWQNLEAFLERKNNLAFFEWNQKPYSDEICKVFFGWGFLLSKYHRDSNFHLFQSILPESSLLKLGFRHLFSSLQSNIRLKSNFKFQHILKDWKHF